MKANFKIMLDFHNLTANIYLLSCAGLKIFVEVHSPWNTKYFTILVIIFLR